MINELKHNRALICGVSGQDGAYLAQFLMSKGYEVWGTTREFYDSSFYGLKTLQVYDKIKLCKMNPESYQSVCQILKLVNPSEIYNLSGQSSVGLSFEKPLETFSSNAVGTLNLLEAIKVINKNIKFFNSGSGEVFGAMDGMPSNELSDFNPQTPYGVSKAAATTLVKLYRETYGIFAVTGLLFNHESPLRSERFVTQKIVATVKRIAAGSKEKLYLGNLHIQRDWGWAQEYVVAMWSMLKYFTPEDFVISTGQVCTIKSFVEAVFCEANIDWRDYVITDKRLFRVNEATYSCGNSFKANKLLGWKPTIIGVEVAKKMYREFGLIINK